MPIIQRDLDRNPLLLNMIQTRYNDMGPYYMFDTIKCLTMYTIIWILSTVYNEIMFQSFPKGIE